MSLKHFLQPDIRGADEAVSTFLFPIILKAFHRAGRKVITQSILYQLINHVFQHFPTRSAQVFGQKGLLRRLTRGFELLVDAELICNLDFFQ